MGEELVAEGLTWLLSGFAFGLSYGVWAYKKRFSATADEKRELPKKLSEAAKPNEKRTISENCETLADALPVKRRRKRSVLERAVVVMPKNISEHERVAVSRAAEALGISHISLSTSRSEANLVSIKRRSMMQLTDVRSRSLSSPELAVVRVTDKAALKEVRRLRTCYHYNVYVLNDFL